jgi:hypothetical protein
MIRGWPPCGAASQNRASVGRGATLSNGTQQLDFAIAITRTIQVFAETMSREQCMESSRKLRALEGDAESRAFFAGMALTLDELVPRVKR